MRKAAVAAAIVLGFLWAMSATPADAATFTGTPCPTGTDTGPCPSPLFGTLIDFDDLATGVTVPAGQYAALGVTSITNINANGAALMTFAGTQSDPNYVGTGDTYGWDATIWIEFASPTSKVGIGVADSVGVDTLSILDASGSVIESATVVSGLNVYQGFEIATNSIKFFKIDCDFCAIDDLQFIRTGVSEPASLLIFASGLLPLVGLRRLWAVRRA